MPSGFFDDFLEKKQTDAIKGFFILMVLMSHCLLEINTAGFLPSRSLDILCFRIRSEFGQLIVVMFLFYSGYGVMESIKKKGSEYLDHFPRRRLLTTLLNFDVAVLVYVVLNLVWGVHMTLGQIGWSFIGWESVGNSNWYIFVILYCYLVTWVCGKLFIHCDLKMVLWTSFLIFAGEIALSFLKHGQSWWYNTMLCYPAGMFLSFFKEPIIAFFKRYYYPVLGLVLLMFLCLHFQSFIPSFRGLTHNAKSIVFSFLVVLSTMKVKTGNRFLYWAGLCVFPIYIYQRLPMRAIRFGVGKPWICANPFLFIAVCVLVTGCIVWGYKYWRIKLN